jgi:hypothetical protein
MKLAARSAVRPLALFTAAAALFACESGPPKPLYNEGGYLEYTFVPECDKTVTIEKDSPALIVTDPEALAGLQLETVMRQLLNSWYDTNTTPLQLAQRLFDGSNNDSAAVFSDTYHCDSSDNPAHANGPAAFCPRSEGALAASDGLFTPGHKDHFIPVAVVNRFDLTPAAAGTCGEARIVYAKESGLTDPKDRVFLIVEAAMPNPHIGDLLGCRHTAQFWKSLEAEPDAKAVGQRLESFFFDGLDGNVPPIDPVNLGFGTNSGASYYGTGGQIRISQHMDEHWELRQLVMSTPNGLGFDPVPVGNNPLPGLFGPTNGQPTSAQKVFAGSFVDNSLAGLASSQLHHIRSTFTPEVLSGESALGGDALNDYVGRSADNSYLRDQIQARLDSSGAGADCPSDDPLTADSILRRATMDSCAGCHAPSQFLGKERKIGCGLAWPDSLGEVHIDEAGHLSPALKDVFLPHRADVLTAYLQSCDAAAIEDAFGAPPGGGTSAKALDTRRTIGGSSTH